MIFPWRRFQIRLTTHAWDRLSQSVKPYQSRLAVQSVSFLSNKTFLYWSAKYHSWVSFDLSRIPWQEHLSLWCVSYRLVEYVFKRFDLELASRIFAGQLLNCQIAHAQRETDVWGLLGDWEIFPTEHCSVVFYCVAWRLTGNADLVHSCDHTKDWKRNLWVSANEISVLLLHTVFVAHHHIHCDVSTCNYPRP